MAVQKRVLCQIRWRKNAVIMHTTTALA